MPREPRANTLLTVITPGIARVSSLFTQVVRQRAVSYLSNGSIRVTASEPALLSARIQGSETYSCLYRREGQTLQYACTCPFFQDRQEGCKHLWALALSARDNPLIEGAASFEKLVPAPELVAAASEKRSDADEPESEAEVEQQTEEAAVARRASARAARWQDVIERVEAQGAGSSSLFELVYFVRFTPQSSPGFSLLLGRRRLGARPGTLEPAQRMTQGRARSRRGSSGPRARLRHHRSRLRVSPALAAPPRHDPGRLRAAAPARARAQRALPRRPRAAR